MAKSPYVHENLSDDDDDEVLKDGEKRTVTMLMRDALAEYSERFPTNDAKRFGLNDALALHKPGQRFSVDATARARVEQARAEGIREMCDAWRTPTGRGEQPGDVCTINGAPGHLNHRLECIPDRSQDSFSTPRVMDAASAQAIKDAAYAEMVNELVTAWQRKP